MLNCFVHADDLRVGLRAYQARKSITRATANTAAFVRVLLVEHHANGNMERIESHTREVIGQLLNARFMADCGPRIVRSRRRFGRILAAIAVHLVQVFRLSVVRLQIVVADRPCGRNAAVVAQLAEVFLAKAEQCRAVKLGVSANVVVGVRMQVLAVLVEPGLLSVVMAFHVHELRVPVRLFARDEVAAFEDEDSFAGRRQMISQGAATGPGSDDDYVIVIFIHDANPPLAPQKMQRLSLSWWSLQHFTATFPLRQRYSSAAESMPSSGAIR